MISLIIGRQGSGKTIYLVKCAQEYAQMGRMVYSNIHLKQIIYKPINYDDIINCRYQDCIVIVDEAHQLLPSRACMSKISRLIVDRFVSMCRKKKVHLMLSTQMARKIDVRIRIEHDFLIECQKFCYTDNVFSVVLGDDNLPSEVPTIIKCAVTEQYSGKTIETIILANNYYRLFDTSEIIQIDIPEKYTPPPKILK